LTTLHGDSLLLGIPAAGCWGLKGNEDSFINLDGWDPQQRNLNVYKVIALPITSDPATLTPIHPQWATLGSQTSSVKSIQLPSQEIFEIRGSHLLVVVHCSVNVRISNRKRRMEKTQHRLLIPADLKAADLAKVFRVFGNVWGLFEIPDLSGNIWTKGTQTASELGWKNGTELRLEML
jgi:hypothetical protein